jgi:hypothetical protein
MYRFYVTNPTILFHIVGTMHFGMKRYNNQSNAHVFNLLIYLLLPSAG